MWSLASELMSKEDDIETAQKEEIAKDVTAVTYGGEYQFVHMVDQRLIMTRDA